MLGNNDYSTSEKSDNQQNQIIQVGESLGGVVVRCVDLETGEILLPGVGGGVLRARGVARRVHARAGSLTTAHISPFCEDKKSCVQIWTDGGLIKAQKTGPYNLAHAGGGKRGAIKVMSKASRRRLQRTIAQTKQSVKPIFITLTYPDQFPNDREKWKRDIDCLAKRMKRRKLGGVWRIEFKARQTGERKGEVAPHFHLLVWGQDLIDLCGWMPKAWFQIVKSGDIKHFSRGVDIEEIKSWRGVMSYTSKYITKADNEIIPAGAGRFWGVFGKCFIPWSDVLEMQASDKQVNIMFRYLRRYMKIRSAHQMPSMTVLISNPARWQSLMGTL